MAFVMLQLIEKSKSSVILKGQERMVGDGSYVQETQIECPKEWIDKKCEINKEEKRKI